MRYPAIITHEGAQTLAEFPDCPGCQTFADPGERIENQARDALEGWLRAGLRVAHKLPRPPRRAPKVSRRASVLWVEVSPQLAVKIELRWARERAGLSQAELAQRVGVSQVAIAKLERPDSNPTMGTLERVARALGARLEISLQPT